MALFRPILAGTMLFLNSLSVWAVTLQASTDVQTLQVGQTVHLKVQADANLNEDALDVRPLFRDFIIGNIRITHPDPQQTLWDIPLQPVASGSIQIPVMPVAGAETQPLSLTVTASQNNGSSTVIASTAPMDNSQPDNSSPTMSASSSSSDALMLNDEGQLVAQPKEHPMIEASVSVDHAYPQQLFIYGLKVAASDQIEPSLLDLKSNDDYQVIPFEKPLEDKEIFRDKYQATKVYQYFIIPKHAGAIVLPAQIALDHSEVTAEPLIIQIQERPKTEANDSTPWLPSAGLTLEQRWDPPTSFTQAHQPITRIITITGINNTLDQLPKIPLPTLPGIKSYTDHEEQSQTEQNGMLISQRIARQVFVPTTDAALTIPEMHVTWWNTISDRSQQATLGERMFSSKKIVTQSPTAKPVQPKPIARVWHWQPIVMVFLLILGLCLLICNLVAGLAYDWLRWRFLRHLAWTDFKKACQQHDLIVVYQTLLHYAELRYQRPFTSLEQLPFFQSAQPELDRFSQYCFGNQEHQQSWNGSQFFKTMAKFSK